MSTPTLVLDGLWGRPWRMGILARVLRARCGPTEVFRYDASGRVPIEELGRRLAETIRRRDEPVNLVGFSMGGLVIRAAHLLDPTLPIRRAVFLCSPHTGSWMAYALPLRGIRQMRPSSDFLRAINDASWTVPTLAVWCPMDAMVLPGRRAMFAGATRMMRCNVPLHPWPIYSRSIHARVAEFLLADTPDTDESTMPPIILRARH